MQKWEYCGAKVNIGGQFLDPNDNQWRSLAELGDEGWEMVQVVGWTQDKFASGFAFFRRPVLSQGPVYMLTRSERDSICQP